MKNPLASLSSIDFSGIALILAIGFYGGTAAYFVGLPIPFLIGSLVTVAIFSIVTNAAGRVPPKIPPSMRAAFIAVIGVMIGATFTPDLITKLPELWPSLLAMVAFIGAAFFVGFVIFRRIGGYDRVTATYCAMPGGLIESVAIGEAAGGDVRILSLQHFTRIVLTVLTVPMLFLLWRGEAVGSAAGQAFSSAPSALVDVMHVVVLAALGYVVGDTLRLPAGRLTGPLILSALTHGTGIWGTASPTWLLNVAQLVVGTGLGAMFGGATLSMLVRAVGLGLLSVGSMLALGIAFAVALAQVVPLDVEALFISYAPGGVTEMGLIALSLGVSPVIVAVHHVFRIGLTVLFAGLLNRSHNKRKAP
ncbi:MAG: AbrB family transcriptional regulator [Pseudomonadota bacterium]